MMRNRVDDSEDNALPSLKKSVVLTIVGLIGIVLGSNFVVDSASGLAKIIGISERMISLTILAIGTSFPSIFSFITFDALMRLNKAGVCTSTAQDY